MLKYYGNYLTNISRTPDQKYFDDIQAFSNEVWDNSTQTGFEIKQQQGIGSDQYVVWAISVDMMLDLATGKKKSDDWKVFSYRDFGSNIVIGIMYTYADNYWLAVNTDELGGAVKSVEARRCNNKLKWVDKTNGYVHNVPCVVDYTVQSPQPLKNSDINTANGHITVWCQGNSETLTLKKNDRFLFNGEPYKLVGYNNMLQNNIVDENTTILYFDMYLDTLQPYDDDVHNIANANQWVYDIKAETTVTQQVTGFTGQAKATVTLNGNVVDRNVTWSGNDYVTIDSNGNYTLTGTTGKVATISANIEGNSTLVSTINIQIVDSVQDVYELLMNPLYTEVRLKQPITFSVNLYKNGAIQSDVVNYTASGLDNSYYTISRNGNTFTLTALKFSNTPLSITFSTTEAEITKNITLKSLF